MTWRLYELTPPAKWQAGTIGSGDNARPLYFDCAGCAAPEPEIAGILAQAPTFGAIALIGTEPGRIRPAMYCRGCWPAIKAGERLPREAAVFGGAS